MSTIREPAVSGTFYPDNSAKLKKEIQGYLENAHVPVLEGDICGIVSPHAGYIYSGQVAAYGYKAIFGQRYDTVIVIAPSHRVYFDGVALWDKGGFETPLGVVDVDEEVAQKLLKADGIIQHGIEPHMQEHALEVQLPFLQTVLHDFKIIPLIMGTQTDSACRMAAEEIFQVLSRGSKRSLIVGSSDLSHYYPYGEALELDNVIARDLGAFDIQGLMRDIETGKTEACGAGPMIVTLMVSEKLGANRAQVLRYANSGDVSGDKSGVVGYVSAVFYQEKLVGGNR